MIERFRRLIFCIVVILMFSGMFVAFNVTASPPLVPPLILEHSEEWSVDITGGMEVWSVFAADVDDDGVVEMMTVAEANESGELRIWSIMGSTLTLEHAELWNSTGGHTRVWAVFALDVDNDGVTEILTGAEAWNGQNGVYYNGQLHIWNWNGSILTLEHGEEWHIGNNTHVYSVFAGDVDNDGKVEIVTGGDAFDNQSQYIAEFRVWNWNGSTLTLETSQGWRTGNYAAIQSVYADDVDNDSVPEIVTCGNDGSDAQLRIWNWNG
ncbi:MAG: VCBS repeat-containing protein, partial [Candidatus Bathyarchaeota archaeon]